MVGVRLRPVVCRVEVWRVEVVVKIKVDTSGMKNSKWYEFALRFSFGGAVTAFAGLVAERYGPEVGGLFLAFPAIVPATATLIRKRERQKKERAGYEGAGRGRAAAAVDVTGAAMGGLRSDRILRHRLAENHGMENSNCARRRHRSLVFSCIFHLATSRSSRPPTSRPPAQRPHSHFARTRG